jgi:uncharacterized protein GlcG (DUF336 family)
MITLAVANQIVEAAIKKAKEIQRPMCIAVVDEGANMVQHVRMDGGSLGSVDISLNKAYTARAFNCTTKELGLNSQPGGQFYGIHVSNLGKIMIFAGGIPLKHNGKIVGAIGVSSGSEEEDVAVAEAGVAAFEKIADRELVGV